MKQYKTNYLNATKKTRYDIILCENCSTVAVDIHHVEFKSQGGTDDYSNLIALCRNCHDQAHNKGGCNEFKIKLLQICNERC